MARKFYQSPRLYDALKAEGYELPADCADVEMVLPVDGIIQLKLVVNLTGKSLQQFGRALAAIGAETQDDVPVTQWPSVSAEDAIENSRQLLEQMSKSGNRTFIPAEAIGDKL